MVIRPAREALVSWLFLSPVCVSGLHIRAAGSGSLTCLINMEVDFFAPHSECKAY
jgi:hypothetical protein